MLKISSKIKVAIIVIFFNFSYTAFAKQKIEVAVFQEHFELINSVYNKESCFEDATPPLILNQMLAEFLLLCKALSFADDKYQLIPVPYPLHKRMRQHLYSGKVILSGMGMWSKDIDKSSVYVSEPIIKKGQFAKGLYYVSGNTKLLNDQPLAFNKLWAVINTNWEYDYNPLKCAGFKVHHADRYRSMFKMLAAGRVDIVPHAFTSHPDFKLVKEQVELYPIIGYKIGINDSSHFVVSKNSQHSKALNTALNNGLRILRETKYIENMYQTLGVIRSETDNWQTLNCDNSH